MSRRFRPKIRVYGNHRHGCSFKLQSIVLLYEMTWNCRATKLLSEIFKILKITKNHLSFQHFFFFFNIFPLEIKIFNKKVYSSEGNGWWISVQNFKSIYSKMAEMWHKTCHKHTFHVISGPYRDFPFFTDFDASKGVLESFFAFFAKIWLNNMYHSSKSRNYFYFTFFSWWPETRAALRCDDWGNEDHLRSILSIQRP